MKKPSAKLLLATTLGSLLTFSSAGWGFGGHGHGPGGRDPEQMLEHMTRRLDLDADQQESIKAIMQSNRDQFTADSKRMEELREQLRDLRGRFDEDRAREMADELGAITSRMAFQLSSTQARVYAELTPEQQEEFDQLSASREHRRNKWRERFYH